MKKRDFLKTSRRCGTPRHVTARNWCTILRTSFDACHRPVAMQVQQPPMNTVCYYVSQLVNNIESHNVCSVLCARAQAFVDQVCRAGSSAAGRRAKFSKWMKNQEPFQSCINHAFLKVLACERTSTSSLWVSARARVSDAHYTVIIAEVSRDTNDNFDSYIFAWFLLIQYLLCVGELVMVSHC